jgi:hypothetical protein
MKMIQDGRLIMKKKTERTKTEEEAAWVVGYLYGYCRKSMADIRSEYRIKRTKELLRQIPEADWIMLIGKGIKHKRIPKECLTLEIELAMKLS